MAVTRQLENERLILKVNDHGGELAGIYDKKNERETVWCADGKYWNRHAPILFPFVGEIYNKEYEYKATKYPMTAHGFARDAEFQFEGINDNKIVHSLTSNEETKKKYPFDFRLEVGHTLVENKVVVEWKVINTGESEMLFSIGAHPAFQVPAVAGEQRKDYFLTFGNEKRESLDYIRISAEDGTALNKDVKQLELTEGLRQVGEHLFDDGVLIFEDSQLAEVGIAFPNKEPYITIKCEGFPYVGVWTKPDAPFICLEPWFGRCDNSGFTGELKEKVGVQTLQAKEAFVVSYDIIIA